jgi:hypothetical protein
LKVKMLRWHQGWQSSLAAAVVLVLLAVAFIAGAGVVALPSKSMPALAQ